MPNNTPDREQPSKTPSETYFFGNEHDGKIYRYTGRNNYEVGRYTDLVIEPVIPNDPKKRPSWNFTFGDRLFKLPTKKVKPISPFRNQVHILINKDLDYSLSFSKITP